MVKSWGNILSKKEIYKMPRYSELRRYDVDCVSIKLVRESMSLKCNRPLDCPGTVARFLYKYFADLDRESCIVVNVDIKSSPLNYNVVSIGTINSSPVVPREIFKSAILPNAYGIIMANNHLSSGRPEPSRNDVNVTMRVNRACEIMGVQLLDHVIIGRTPRRYYSFMGVVLQGEYFAPPGADNKSLAIPSVTPVPPKSGSAASAGGSSSGSSRHWKPCPTR